MVVRYLGPVSAKALPHSPFFSSETVESENRSLKRLLKTMKNRGLSWSYTTIFLRDSCTQLSVLEDMDNYLQSSVRYDSKSENIAGNWEVSMRRRGARLEPPGLKVVPKGRHSRYG